LVEKIVTELAMKCSWIIYGYDDLNLYLFVKPKISLTSLKNELTILIGTLQKILIVGKILDMS
jgi:hypothetical protein